MIRAPLTLITTLATLAALATFSATFSATASAQLRTFGGDGEMKTSSVYLWDTGKQKLVGGYTFLYGSPEWKDEHEAHVESKEDGSIRLGKNEWATLDTSVAMSIGGTRIPAGQWYLGLRRENGQFALMVMKAATIRDKKIGGWMTAQVQAKINAPLQYRKVDEKASKLVITAKADAKNPVHGTFTLHWGKHQLSAKIEVDLTPNEDDAKEIPTSRATPAKEKR